MEGKYRPRSQSTGVRVSRAGKLHPVKFETILVDPAASFSVQQLRISHFPFCWHYHPELEIALILEGEGLRFVGDSIESFEAGDLCLLGSSLPHTWSSSPCQGKKARSVYIQFTADCFGEDFFRVPEMRPIYKMFLTARRGIRFRGQVRQSIMERMISMQGRQRSRWRQISDLIWILGTLAESDHGTPLALNGLTPSLNGQGDQRLRRALGFMNADVNAIPSQRMAAQHTRLSPQAFSRFFKRAIGKTYVRYRNELRIGRVCRLLLDTDQSITQIALDSGFNNLSNFNEQFLSVKGVTPRSYRINALKAASR